MEKAMKAFNNKEYKKSIKYSNRAEIFLKKEAKEIEKGSSK